MLFNCMFKPNNYGGESGRSFYSRGALNLNNELTLLYGGRAC